MKKLVLYSVILMLSQCNKYDDTQLAANLQVPPYTDAGANTFGCLVNGAVWANLGENYVHQELGGGSLIPNVVRGSFYFDDSITDSVYAVTAGLTVSKRGDVLREENMMINVPFASKGKQVGIHQLVAKDGLFFYTNGITDITYSSKARNPFTVTIKKDSLLQSGHRIVSGTFSGMLYSYVKIDSLRIVGGVFDTLVQ